MNLNFRVGLHSSFADWIENTLIKRQIFTPSGHHRKVEMGKDGKFFGSRRIERQPSWAIVAHVFNPGTGEAEVGRSVSSRPA